MLLPVETLIIPFEYARICLLYSHERGNELIDVIVVDDFIEFIEFKEFIDIVGELIDDDRVVRNVNHDGGLHGSKWLYVWGVY